MLLVVRPGASSSVLLLVAMPGAPSSFLFPVASCRVVLGQRLDHSAIGISASSEALLSSKAATGEYISSRARIVDSPTRET